MRWVCPRAEVTRFSEGIAIGADPGASQEFPAVAWSGTRYLVTWTESRETWDIAAAA